MEIKKDIHKAIKNAIANKDSSDIYELLENKEVILDMITNPEYYKKIEFIGYLYNDERFLREDYEDFYNYKFLCSKEFIEMLKQYKESIKEIHPKMDAYKCLELFLQIPNDSVVEKIFCNNEVASHIKEKNPLWFSQLVNRLENLDELLVYLYANNDIKNIKKALEIKSQHSKKQI